MIDVACGDWNWMKKVDLSGIDYTGYDSDEGFIEENQMFYPDHKFIAVDALKVHWPEVDLILCRDFMIHIPTDAVRHLLQAFNASQSRYLLSTSYDDIKENFDFDEKQKSVGYDRLRREWRPVNLELPPYSLGQPVDFIRENYEVCTNRKVGLWQITE